MENIHQSSTPLFFVLRKTGKSALFYFILWLQLFRCSAELFCISVFLYVSRPTGISLIFSFMDNEIVTNYIFYTRNISATMRDRWGK